MKSVAMARTNALPPGNLWNRSYSDLLVDAAAPVVDGRSVDGIFCASPPSTMGQSNPAALLADRLGLKPRIALSLDCADISAASALYAAFQHVRSGLCTYALVAGAAKVSDLSESERLALMDLTLDRDADVSRGIDFHTQAGLLAGEYCRVRECDPSVFADTTAANYAAWSKHAKTPMPSSAELRRDLSVSPPLVRSDFPQLVDGGCAVLLAPVPEKDAVSTIAAMAASTDIVSIWERKDPLAFRAVEGALQALGDTTVSWLEVDCGASVAQRLAQEAVQRASGNSGAGRTNCRGGAFGRGRVYGVSPLYQLVDICESAATHETAHLLALSGLGSHVFSMKVAGPA